MKNIFHPPDDIRCMKTLNKDKIKTTVQVHCLSINEKNLQGIVPLLKKYLMKIEKFKPIQLIADNKVDIYLSPELIKNWSGFPNDIQSALEKNSVTENDLKIKNIELTYENFSAEDLLRAILPSDKEGLSSFTKIGHIVHVNLREHLLPFKSIIGDILFDKVQGCKSIVNKVNMIDNTYRNFHMELLKGENNMITAVKENNCTFKFDFSKVYWNSRLCTEHERIIKKLNQQDVLFDVFAGVGPFSIPAAKKRCVVYANDLNPESYKWLEYNAKANKISNEYFQSFNKDGADFIKTEIKKHLPINLENEKNIFITMNLPALAVNFLANFEGLFNPDELPNITKTPLIFLYCFVKGENYTELAKELILENFNCNDSDIIDIFRVRTVSSLKEMMRVTIKLTREILTTENLRKRKFEDQEDNNTKRSKDGKEQEESR
ncbi:tRNA (guanine(37)-N1)-methyltransferase [Diorhabda sublineata]|uniref:tRNA (guanine(37)-N1)-methyltransferase n=1 Tax=Diorhabda sublineata TaxID=1163346 RepID=UPI0024E08696|nr:tRNA (guanine(37)-N1)-methyltransferase [Diorhabda sublineata]